LHKAFDDYFKAAGNAYPILLKVDRETVCVQSNDVLYLEADNKKCFVNLIDGRRLHCAKTMAEISKSVPEKVFFKVHKAFIVNFNHVGKYDSEYIYFKSGGRVRVTRTYITSFKKAYMSFVKSRVI